MIAMAGEVADGFLCGPLTSSLSFREYTLAALRRGRAAGPEAPATPFEVCAMPLVVTGPDAATTERVARATRRRIAFYASTPAYRHILELHGWEALHNRLYELSRRGAWDEMADLIDDQVLETFAVVAEPDSVAAALLDRFADDADRVIVHSALDPGHDVWRTVVAGAPQRARPAAR
jgi:alkanesulfonate monooxygenase SsuD/methylene tetrahydromethanopterin reductase-like flavin-dependent oxidoreductase (luciferase family)